MFFRRPPLSALLTVPYVVLVLATAGIIGWLSLQAGRNAVDNLSGQLLGEMVNRIAQAVDRHVAGSAAVLEAAFPQGVPAPASLDSGLDELRTRFWLATSVHRDPNNYAYYGDRQGRFFGLWRHSDQEAELRLRKQGQGPRSIYRFSGIKGPLGEVAQEDRMFDPRERPWYRAAQSSTTPTWTSIYIDFKTSELVATRARRVNNSAGDFEGVVATDLSLQRVNAFLRRLALSENGLALVVEGDGNIIGVSRGPHLRVLGGDSQAQAGAQTGPALGSAAQPQPSTQLNARLNAAEHSDPMVVATYAAVRGLLAKQTAQAPSAPSTGSFTGPGGEVVQVAYASLRDEAGLDWQLMVAVPRNDFLAEINTSFRNASVLAVLASAVVLLMGWLTLMTVTRELRVLTRAAKGVADGSVSPPVTSDRNDELGALTRSFGDMQRRLLTDPLTGLANREAVVRRIEERLLQQRRLRDARPFAVLFADLNDFKSINDVYGHEVGDEALCELAKRLKSAVRGHDLVARFAGDEFVVFVETAGRRRDAETVRSHIEAVLKQPLQALVGRSPNTGLGASTGAGAATGAGAGAAPVVVPAPPMGGACGLAYYPEDGQDLQTLLKTADDDMYRRKPRA
jgi:diguanylate cyclase (GGDEF)-like protein